MGSLKLKNKRRDLFEEVFVNHRKVPGRYRTPERIKRNLFRVITGSTATTLTAVTVSHGLPQGATVVSGNVNINQAPAQMVINQMTDKAIVNWISFSIDRGELVRFNQPGINAVILNRVTGQDPSVILGQLTANGRVFLVNPNGIIFGKSAVVDVAGLMATTLNITDSDFLSGNYKFTQLDDRKLAQVINEGQIKVSDGGFVILSAPSVINEGLIYARVGTVVMGSGTQIKFDFTGNSLITFSIDAPVGEKVIKESGETVKSGVKNTGVIKNDGGTVLLTGDALQQVFSSVVNNEGIVEAKSLSIKGGKIIIEGNSGTVENTGQLDVSAYEGGKSGEISITADTIVNDGIISANGNTDADGGSIYIFSDRLTELGENSTIEAIGKGANSSGGFIEVSSRKEVRLGGGIFVYSEEGKSGKVIIDPEDLIIDKNYYTAGGDYLFEATNSITVNSGIVISTRNTGDPTATGDAPNDQLTSPSVGDSGNLELKAPDITIGQNARLLTFADSGYSSGSIKITAEGTTTNITIETGVLLKGGDITISASSSNDSLFDPDNDVAGRVDIDFLDSTTQYYAPGAFVDVKAISKIDIKSDSSIEGSNVSIKASSAGSASAKVRLNRSNVTYAVVDSEAEINLDGKIVSEGAVTISADASETLVSEATSINLGQRDSNKDMFLSIAYGKGTLVSRVTVGSSSSIEGSTVTISSTGTKDVSVRGKGAAYEDGTLSGGIAIAFLDDTVETSVSGMVKSVSGNVSVSSTLNVTQIKVKSDASSGTGKLTPVTDTSTLLETKGVDRFIDKNSPQPQSESGKSKFNFSATLTFLENKSDVTSFLGTGGSIYSGADLDINSQLKYQDVGIKSGASASVNNNDQNKKDYSFAGVFNLVKSDETVKAYIGSNATANLKGNLSVYSNIYIPHSLTPSYTDAKTYDNDMQEFFDEVRGYVEGVLPNNKTISTSGGEVVGIAGMVNILMFNEKSHAYIDSGASINQDKNFVTVPKSVSIKADNSFDYFNFSGDVGGDISSKDQTAVGGAYVGIYLDFDTQAFINNDAYVDAENLEIKANTDIFLANFAVAGGFADEYGVSGIFNYLSLDETTKAFTADNANLSVGSVPVDQNGNGIIDVDETESFVVDAVSRNRILTVSGGIVRSHSVGIGASVGVNKITRTTEAYISGNISTDGDIKVRGETQGWITAASLAGTYTSPNKFKGIEEDDPLDGASLPNLFGESSQDASVPQSGVSIAGTSSINIVNGTTKAYLDNASITGTTGSAGNITLSALDKSGIYSAGGTVAVANTSSSSAGLAGGFFGNYITTDVQSYVNSSTLSLAGLKSSAEDNTIIMAVGGGGAVAINDENKISVSLAGSVTKNSVNKNIKSYIYDSSVQTAGLTSLTVTDSSKTVSAAGDMSVSGYSAGAAIALNDVKGDEHAFIENSDISAQSLTVKSTGNTSHQDISVSASASLDKLAAAASVSINHIALNNSAYIKGRKTAGISVVEDVNVEADSSQSITVISGSTAANLKLSGLGIGGSASYNTIGNTVDAHVDGTSVSSSTGNLSTRATQNLKTTTVAINTEVSKLNIGVNLAINRFSNTTLSYISSSDVDVFGSAGVLSTYSADNEVYGGVLQGGSGGFGLGGSAVVNIYENTTESRIESSTVTAKGNRGITHSNAQQDRTEEISAGVIVISDAREKEKTATATATVGLKGVLALDGSLNFDLYKNRTLAYIKDSDVNPDSTTGNSLQTVKVRSFSGTEIDSGNGGLNFGSSAGVGLSAAVIKFQNTTSAYAENSSIKSRAGGIDISSRTYEDILTVSVAGSISKNISFAGSGNAIYLDGTTSAYLKGSSAWTEGNLDIKAEDTVRVGNKDQDGNYDAGAIAGSVSVGGSTVGVGGSVNIIDVTNRTHAYIAGSTVDAMLDIGVSSISDKLFSVYASNVAASAVAGIGGSVNVLLVSTDTKAFIGKDDTGNGSTINGNYSGPVQNVKVSSTDKTDYKSGVGSGEVSKLIAAGGAVDVAIINVKNRAYVGEDTSVQAGNSVGITSYTENITDSTVIAFGGGLGGVSGSVSITNIGKAFDSDQSEASGDIGGSLDGSIDVYSDVDTGNPSANSELTDAKQGLLVSSYFEPGAVFDSVTASFVSRNSQVHAGSGGVRINATESTSIKSVVGAISGGAVGVSGSVSVQKNYSNLFAYADSGSVLGSSGNISIDSTRIVGANISTYAGEGGGVTLGAAVSYLYLGGDIYSYLGDGVTVTDSTHLIISTSETNSAEINAYGTHAGLAVAGGAASKAVVESNVHSYTGSDTDIGNSSEKDRVKKVSITAKTDTTVRASALPVNVGAVSAQAAVVDIQYRTNVRAYTGIRNSIYTSGELDIESTGTYELYGSTTGVNLGGAVAGASVTLIDISPDIKSYIYDGNKIEAGSVSVSAGIEDPSNSSTDGSAYAEARASASSGAGLLGASGAVSKINNKSSVDAHIGSSSDVRFDDYLSLNSYLKGRSYSHATGVGIGFLGAGVSITQNQSDINVSAGINSSGRIYSDSGEFNISAYSLYGSKAESVAGSGGVVSGNASVAQNDITGTNRIYFDKDVHIHGKTGRISSNRNIEFNSIADSRNASILGMSGAFTEDTVHDSYSKIDVDSGTTIEGYSLSIEAKNSHTKNNNGWISGGDNSQAGSGGVFSGVASQSTVTIKNTSAQVNLGDGSSVYLLGNPTNFYNLEKLLIESYSYFDIKTKAKLTAGGAIVGAKSDARVDASEGIGSSVNIGKDVDITVNGNLVIASSTSGTVSADARTYTYGLASAGQGKSKAKLVADDGLTVDSGSNIKVFGDATLVAGRSSWGSGYINSYAYTDVYNKTAIAYSGTPDADATSTKIAYVYLKQNSSLKTGKNINLISTKGNLYAYGYGKATDASREVIEDIASFFSNLFGGDDVSLDTIAGTGIAEGDGSIIVDGNVETGLYRHVYITFGEGMNPGFYITEDTDSSGNLVSNLVPNRVEYENGEWKVYDPDGRYIKTLTPEDKSEIGIDWEILKDIRIATSLDKQIEQLKNLKKTYPELADDIDATIATLEGQKTDPATNQTTHIIKLKDIVASSGNISLRADNLYGLGQLKAPGDVKIEIINNSPLPVEVGQVEIPRDYGGKIEYNGKRISKTVDIILMNKNKFIPVNLSLEDAQNSPPPSILIQSTYKKTYVGTDSNGNSFYIYPPPILIGPVNAISADDDSVSVSGDSPTGHKAVSNFSGSVTIKNNNGSVFVTEDIFANTITISAGGNFVFNNPKLVFNVAYSPDAYFSYFHDYSKDKLSLQENGEYSTDVDSDLQSRYDSLLQETYNHSDKYLLAGNNIFINAEVININGLIQSGIPYKDVTITEEMINNAIASGNYTLFNGEEQYDSTRDLFVGKYNVTINPDEKKIYVSGLDITGGTVFLSGKIANTGGGKINVMDGFGKININNQSSYELVLDSIDTGNIEGKVTIVDKMKDNGVGRYLVTEYRRIGNEVRIYTNQGIDSSQATVLVSSSYGRNATYTPFAGLRYYWMDGYTTSSLVKIEFYKIFSKFLGFIPVADRSFTDTDIREKTTENLDNQNLNQGFVQGFMRDADGNIITSPPDYNMEKVTTYNYDYTIQRDFIGSLWDFLLRKTWIKRLLYEYSGTTTKFYSSVKADYPVEIVFIGEDAGEVNINSSSNVILKSGITNIGGVVNINTAGSLYTETLAPINAGTINITAPGSVGTVDNPVRVTGNPVVSIGANINGVYIDTISSDITVSSGIYTAGDLRIRSDKSVIIGGLLKARDIHIEARNGFISSGNPLDPYINIDTDFDNGGKLYMTATDGDIYVREITGDLSVHTISTLGNVYVQVTDGSLADGNPNENVDERTAAELELLYNDLGLQDTAAQQLREQQIDSLKHSMEMEYDRYWREYRDLKLNPDGTYSYTPYKPVEFKFTQDEIDALKAQGWTDEMITDYEQKMTDKYNTWGQSDYNPDFTYVPTQEEIDNLSANEWTDEQLNNTLPASLFNKKVTDTEYKIEQPNISGNNITIITSGSIGKDKKNNILFYYNDTGRYTQDELDEIKRALVAAERQDIEIDTQNEVIIIKQRDDIDIESYGYIQAIAGGPVYIGSESDVKVTNIYSKNDWVRIKTGEGIYSYSPGLNVDAPQGLILEASNGPIGTETEPFSVSVGPDATITARAAGDINLLVPYGDLNIDYIYSRGNVSLTVPNGSIIDFYSDSIEDITATSLTLTAGVYGGMPGSYDKALDVELTEPDGRINLYGYGSFNIYKEDSIIFGDINIGGDLTPRTLENIIFDGKTAANKVEVDINGSITVNDDMATVEGVILKTASDIRYTGSISSNGYISLLSGGNIHGSDRIYSAGPVILDADGDITTDGKAGAGSFTSLVIKSGGNIHLDSTGGYFAPVLNVNAGRDFYSNSYLSGSRIDINVTGNFEADNGGAVRGYEYLNLIAGGNIKAGNALSARGDVTVRSGGDMELTGYVIGDRVNLDSGGNFRAESSLYISSINGVNIHSGGDIYLGMNTSSRGNITLEAQNITIVKNVQSVEDIDFKAPEFTIESDLNNLIRLINDTRDTVSSTLGGKFDMAQILDYVSQIEEQHSAFLGALDTNTGIYAGVKDFLFTQGITTTLTVSPVTGKTGSELILDNPLPSVSYTPPDVTVVPSDNDSLIISSAGRVYSDHALLTTGGLSITGGDMYLKGLVGGKTLDITSSGTVEIGEKTLLHGVYHSKITSPEKIKGSKVAIATNGEMNITAPEIDIEGFIYAFNNVNPTIRKITDYLDPVLNLDYILTTLDMNPSVDAFIRLNGENKINFAGALLSTGGIDVYSKDISMTSVTAGNYVNITSPSSITVGPDSVVYGVTTIDLNAGGDLSIDGFLGNNGIVRLNSGGDVLIKGSAVSIADLPLDLDTIIDSAGKITAGDVYSAIADFAGTYNPSDSNGVFLNAPDGDITISGNFVSTATAKFTTNNVTISGTAGAKNFVAEVPGNFITEEGSIVYNLGRQIIDVDGYVKIGGYLSGTGEVKIHSTKDVEISGYILSVGNIPFTIDDLVRVVGNGNVNLPYEKVSSFKGEFNALNNNTIEISADGRVDVSGYILTMADVTLRAGDVLNIDRVVLGNSVTLESPNDIPVKDNTVIAAYNNVTINTPKDVQVGGTVATNGNTLINGRNIYISGKVISNEELPINLSDYIKQALNLTPDSMFSELVDVAYSFTDTSDNVVNVDASGLINVTGGIISTYEVNLKAGNSIYIRGDGSYAGSNTNINAGKNVELYAGVKSVKGYMHINAGERIVRLGGPEDRDRIDIEARYTNLNAPSGIGTFDAPLNVKAEKINAISENGGVYINLTGDTFIQQLYAGKEDIAVNLNEGNMTFGQIRSEEGTVYINVPDGEIIGEDNASIWSNSNILLFSSGTPNTGNNPIGITLHRDIFVADTDGVWSFSFTGTVPDWIIFNNGLYGGKRMDVILEALTSVTKPAEDILNIFIQKGVQQIEEEKKEYLHYTMN
ncbi:filamentous hemagglutinin N-terminal domain-containing protein [Persephonella sp.]